MHNLSDNEINIGFRRLKDSSWSTVMARMVVYGLRPYEAFVGEVMQDWFFEIPTTSHRLGRLVPPKFCESIWLDKVAGPLPSITAKTNREFAVRTNQAFRRRDVNFAPSDLRQRWITKLLSSTDNYNQVCKLLGVSLKTISRRIPSDNCLLGSEGYLYVLQHCETGLYKIGVTRKECKTDRFKRLGVGTVNSLIHLELSCEYRELEKQLHSRYKSKRIPQTEYFMLTEEDLSAIQTNAPN